MTITATNTTDPNATPTIAPTESDFTEEELLEEEH